MTASTAACRGDLGEVNRRTCYRSGCRNPLCREAANRYRREWGWRTGRTKPFLAGRTHGRIGTYNGGCRCAICRDTARRKRAESRAKARRDSGGITEVGR